MEFYILDENLDVLDIVDTFKSAIWTTRYFTDGDFELYVPATDKMINLLQKDRFVVRTDDTRKCMIIQNIELQTDVENGNYLSVTGKDLKNILSRRIIWKQITVSGYVEWCVRNLIETNAIDPEDPDRKIPRLELAEEIGLQDKMSTQYTGNNLEEVIQGICKNYKLGYDVELDLDNKKFIFCLYSGVDRSYNQAANPYVVFSNDFENLLSTNYKRSGEAFKNVAKIAGEGEGTARKYAVAGTATGLNRFEMFVDARDVSTNEGEIDEYTYKSLLSERGYAKLAENGIIENIDGEVEPNQTYQLNRDYFLGDIVEVVNEYNISMRPRITEVIESEDDSGHYVIPTFATDEDEKDEESEG